MRFPDWGQKVREQQKRLMAIQLGTARESICLEGRTIVVELTATSGKVEISDSSQSKSVTISDAAAKWSDPRIGLSELFRRYQLEFDQLIKDVTDQVDQLVESFTKLYSMIVERDIPELVMRRIAGEGGSAVGQYQCVEEVASGRMIKQIIDLSTSVPFAVVDRFGWTEEISGKTLQVSWDNTDLRISWGDECQIIKCWGCNPSYEKISLNQTLLYLANFDAIQTALDKGARAAQAASAILQGQTNEIVNVRR